MRHIRKLTWLEYYFGNKVVSRPKVNLDASLGVFPGASRSFLKRAFKPSILPFDLMVANLL